MNPIVTYNLQRIGGDVITVWKETNPASAQRADKVKFPSRRFYPLPFYPDTLYV